MMTGVRRAVATVMLAAGTIQAQVFQLLPLAAPMWNAQGEAVSADGAVVVGAGNGPYPVNSLAFRWTADEGSVLLPSLAGYELAEARTISGDGRTAAGACFSLDFSQIVPCVWGRDNEPTALPLLPGHNRGFAKAVARRAGVIVGVSALSGTNQARAVRWHAHRVESLGIPPGWDTSSAVAVSANGQVIVGSLYKVAPAQQGAFRWTPQGHMEVLPNLTSPGDAIAQGVSDDGRVIVGHGRGLSGNPHAMRWRDGAPPEDLGVPPGYTYSDALAISGDGRVIVGDYRGGSQVRAFVYSDKLGMVDLQTYLTSRGVNLQGFTLFTCFAVSPDGNTMVGRANNPQTHADLAWRVQAPGWF